MTTTAGDPPDPPDDSDGKSRYLAAPRQADFTIDQQWTSYSAAEHDRWDRLFARAGKTLKNRACDQYISALQKLQLSESGIPNLEKLSDRLEEITGWRVVPVLELVPNDIFFNHLANRRFPAGAFIRSERDLDYLKEPDIFHDVFGHVPLLADPAYADFMQAYGKGGQRALALDQLDNLTRLYWYTVEFGLLQSPKGLRIFGAGILSSTTESMFALEDASPNRTAFDLERVMRTKYIIDDFQQTYFVVDSFEKLLEDSYRDFGPIYARLREADDIEADQLIPDDRVLTRGTMEYFKKKRAN